MAGKCLDHIDNKADEKMWPMSRTVGMSRMKSYGLPEVVSVSPALPMLLFVPKLANTGKGANAEG